MNIKGRVKDEGEGERRKKEQTLSKFVEITTKWTKLTSKE